MAKWFTHSVYPVLLSHDFERAAQALKTRSLTKQEFEHLIRRMSAVQRVVEIPPYLLSKHDNKLIRVRTGFAHDLEGRVEKFVIHAHTRMDAVHESEVFLRKLFGPQFESSLGEWKIGHWSHYVGAQFTAETYSLSHHIARFPDDDLSDLIFGLEPTGDLLLDIFPRMGHFSLIEDGEKAVAAREAWKNYLETLIRDHGLMPALPQ